MFSFDFLQIEPLCSHSRRDRAVTSRFVWINVFRDFELCESGANSDRFIPLLLSTEGEVYTWGKGARGRLGRKEEDSGIPKAVQLEESHPFVVTSVACCHGNSLLAVKRNISLITPCEQTVRDAGMW